MGYAALGSAAGLGACLPPAAPQSARCMRIGLPARPRLRSRVWARSGARCCRARRHAKRTAPLRSLTLQRHAANNCMLASPVVCNNILG